VNTGSGFTDSRYEWRILNSLFKRYTDNQEIKIKLSLKIDKI
jgi:hypothetical protein